MLEIIAIVIINNILQLLLFPSNLTIMNNILLDSCNIT